MQSKRWDVFCKIVDHLGDIGVCWRLAKQLHITHGLQVRLFVDDLAAAKPILTGIEVNKEKQQFAGVTIVHWHEALVFNTIADVVIETFACGLPMQYQNKMQADATWVNVDYLSAESWVVGFHAKSSKINNSSLSRHFYFPGFSEATGGLLREHDLLTKRDAFCKDTDAINTFLDRLAVPIKSSLTISMFCYANAPLEALFKIMADGNDDVTVLMPYESHLQTFANLFGQNNVQVGGKFKVGKLTVQVLPFLTQDDYDQLLWTCDINFVRGEDSWVRAIWAGKPFIWQPYLQSDHTHMVKLNAFLALFYADNSVNESVIALHHSWATSELPVLTWQNYLSHLPQLRACTLQESNTLANQSGLVDRLVAFVVEE